MNTPAPPPRSTRADRLERYFGVQAPSWTLRVVVVAVVVWWTSRAAISVLGSLRQLLVTVAISLIAACACEGPVNRMVRLGMRRAAATFALLAGVVLGLAGLAVTTGTLVASQVMHLARNAPATIRQGVELLNRDFHFHLQAPSKVSITASLHSGHLAHLLAARSHGALSGLADVGVTLFLTFYLVADGPKLRRLVCSLWRPAAQPEVLRAWEIAIDKAGGYFLSRGLLTAIRIVVLSVTLVALHISSWYVLAVWFGVLSEFVPVIGTLVGAALPIAVALSVSPARALIVLIAVVVFTQLRNVVLAPKLTKRSVDIHPAVGFLAVIASAKVFGPASALLAIPAVATFQAFTSTYVERHQLSVDSELLVHAPPRAPRRKP
jgi:predicted PurR-regulated permease PerM